MRVEKFCEDIKKIIPCNTIYYPGPAQVVVFLNVNNKSVRLCYDEEFIELNWPEDIFAVVEDDLFRVGLEINTGRV